MPGDFSFQVRGLEKIKGELDGLATDARRLSVEYASRYTVGMLRENSDPPYTYHSRAEAYPQSLTIDYGPHKGKVVQGYFSAKQYYFVTIGVRKGTIEIPHKRSSQIKDGWRLTGAGLNTRIVNSANPQALKYTMAQATQSEHESLIPWPTISGLILEHYPEIIKAAQNGIADYILNYSK
jgi:hypothetical protein